MSCGGGCSRQNFSPWKERNLPLYICKKKDVEYPRVRKGGKIKETQTNFPSSLIHMQEEGRNTLKCRKHR